ncbi:MAG: NACHT domain-containing protein, partial [Cyanobacteria bacterium P01_F01_bin.86]
MLDSKLVNTGVPGAIAGFGISRAFEGEWWQFGSLMGAAAGVWFLIKLGSKIGPRVEKVIDQADQAVDRQVDRTLSTVSGFQQKYLEALRHRCYSLQVEGAKSYVPRLVLEDIYVPLRVNSGSTRYQPARKSTNAIPKIWDFLPHRTASAFPYRLLAIVADPGYGKTTLMRFLTLSFAHQSYEKQEAKALIPVLLLFRDFHERIQSETEPKLPQLTVEQVQKLPRCEALRASESWFNEQLKKGHCLVMLDGLDEVPEAKRKMVSQWTKWQMQNYPTQFILTSRPHGYDGSLFEGVQQLDILDFNNDQKRTFIDRWYAFICWDYWHREWEKSQRQLDETKRLSWEQAKADSEAEAQEAADDLSRQLFAEQSLVELAKNP